MVHADTAPLDDPGYRVMPHNEEAEKALLGALLVNNEVLGRVEHLLEPEHFFVTVHGRIYGACRQIVERGLVANPITLRTLFEKDEALTQAGGAGYLAHLASAAATIINAKDYARQIHDHHVRRQLIQIGEDVVNDAFEHVAHETALDQVERAERALFDLAEYGLRDRDFRHLREITIETLKMMEAAFRRDTAMVGVATGLSDLDDLLGGLHPSDLAILAARPAMGKTALATNIAYHAASRYRTETDDEGRTRLVDGAAVGFFSLEMSAEQIVTRILAEVSRVPSDILRRGNIQQRDFDALVAASQKITDLPLHIDDTPALTVQSLRSRARRLKRRHGLSLLVVDYLQLLRGESKAAGENRVQEVSEVTQGLKALAKELDLPVLALSQLSRAVEQREDKRPLLSDLRDSGSIEQEADVVMFIYREEYYLGRQQPQPKAGEDEQSDAQYRARLERWQQKMDKKRGITEVIVAKHRHGTTGDIEIHFDAATTKFSDLETRYSSDDVPF